VRPTLLLFVLLLFPSSALAQWLSAGVTGGVPLSPQSRQSAPGYLLNGVSGPNDLILKPYTVGGTVQVHLFWKLSTVAEFQYERIHQDFTYSSVKFQLNFGTRGGTSANAWLFPLLLRYDHDRYRLSPFVDLGATLRRVGPFNGSGSQLDISLQPHPVSFHTTPGGNPEIAITAGAGIRTHLSLFDLTSFDLTSEVRFLHWTADYFVPAQNQAVLTVGVTFPARHR